MILHYLIVCIVYYGMLYTQVRYINLYFLIYMEVIIVIACVLHSFLDTGSQYRFVIQFNFAVPDRTVHLKKNSVVIVTL